MRALIQPRPGWELVSADYSQIEVRVMAHFCGDRGLLQLFAERKDVYRLMGGMVFNVRPENVTEQQRSLAKVLALAAIYGQGVEQMAAKMNKSKAEAQQIQGSFFRAFPAIKNFMAMVKDRARKTECVTTILGFRRLLPDINTQDGGLRATAERQAVNTVIQGSAADIIKLAMVMMNENIVKEFETLSLTERPRLLMAVHDELVYEVPPALVDQFARLLSRVMEQEVARSFHLKCPLVIDLSRGLSWGATKPFQLDEHA
jgi:DNA polymerase-1